MYILAERCIHCLLYTSDAAGISRAELSRRLGTSQSAFKQRLDRGRFTQDELDEIANILGCKYFSGFQFPDGLEIR